MTRMITNTPAPDRRAIPEKSGHLYAANDDEVAQFFLELERKFAIFGWGFLSGCLFAVGAAYVWSFL